MSIKSITAVILAGGQGQRMGGKDKGLITFNNRPLVAHQIKSFKPYVDQFVISANRNLDQYQTYGHPVVSDDSPTYQGPLAGIAAALETIRTDYALVIACDMPLLPGNIVDRLYNAVTISHCDIAIPHDGTRAQPLCMLLRSQLKVSLKQAVSHNQLKVIRWIQEQSHSLVDCSDIKECFININNATELASLELKN